MLNKLCILSKEIGQGITGNFVYNEGNLWPCWSKDIPWHHATNSTPIFSAIHNEILRSTNSETLCCCFFMGDYQKKSFMVAQECWVVVPNFLYFRCATFIGFLAQPIKWQTFQPKKKPNIWCLPLASLSCNQYCFGSLLDFCTFLVVQLVSLLFWEFLLLF